EPIGHAGHRGRNDGTCRMNGRSQDSTGSESPTIDLGQTGTTEIGATVFLPVEESGPVRPVEARVLGRYENLGEIARGAMARAYPVPDPLPHPHLTPT